jgi:hypothetical protein
MSPGPQQLVAALTAPLTVPVAPPLHAFIGCGDKAHAPPVAFDGGLLVPPPSPAARVPDDIALPL